MTFIQQFLPVHFYGNSTDKNLTLNFSPQVLKTQVLIRGFLLQQATKISHFMTTLPNLLFKSNNGLNENMFLLVPSLGFSFLFFCVLSFFPVSGDCSTPLSWNFSSVWTETSTFLKKNLGRLFQELISLFPLVKLGRNLEKI